MPYACSQAQLAGVQGIVADSSIATQICEQYDVATVGPQAAVLRYLTASQQAQQQGNSIDVQFILFSSYLVFLMQSGFAMVSKDNVNNCGCSQQAHGPPEDYHNSSSASAQNEGLVQQEAKSRLETHAAALYDLFDLMACTKNFHSPSSGCMPVQ